MRVDAQYCNGKVIYDKRGATTAKNKRYEEDHQVLRIYPCKRCQGWHLTKQDFMDYNLKYNASNRNKNRGRGGY